MSLDGVCLFRQENKPAPRSFHHHLFSFGGFFKPSHWENAAPEDMLRNLAQRSYVRYDKAVLEESDSRKVLTLTCKKKEPLSPIVTNAIEVYMRKITTVIYKDKGSITKQFGKKSFYEHTVRNQQDYDEIWEYKVIIQYINPYTTLALSPYTITGPAMVNIFAAVPKIMPSAGVQAGHTLF